MTGRIAYRAEQTGDLSTDRAQRLAQQAAQRLNTAVGRYLTVGVTQATMLANFTTTSTTAVDTGVSVLVSCFANDLLFIDFAALCGSSTTSGCQIQLAVIDGLTTTNPGIAGWAAGTVATISPLKAIYKVLYKGSVTVKVQAIAAAGATLTIYSGSPGGTPTLSIEQKRAF